jgi:hypothetical protein
MEVIPPWLVAYAHSVVKTHNIDSSHGVDHGIAVAKYAATITDCQDCCLDKSHCNLIPGLSHDDARRVIIIAAFVHDLVDHKYVDPIEATREMKHEFTKHHMDDVLITYIDVIINNISFSKRVHRRKLGKKMIDMAELGCPELQLATEIVCDADMLDAYDPIRCINYRLHSMPNNPDNLRWAKLILSKRVLSYKSMFLNTNSSKKIAEPLHDELQEYLDVNMSDIICSDLVYDI